MRVGIKAKQIAGVTAIVGMVVVALSMMQLAALARLSAQESRERARLLQQAIWHRAFQVVPTSKDPYTGLGTDPGLRSILEAVNYSKGLTYAAIVDRSETAIAHSDPTMIGSKVPKPAGYLDELLAQNGLAIYWRFRTSGGEMLEVYEPLMLGEDKFGAIRIGVSTLLVAKELRKAMEPALLTALAALGVAVLVSMFFAQLMLRPIHVIRGALSRLGQGELGVRLDMPQKDEFGELGSFFNSLSAQLSADRSTLAGEKAKLESVVDRLEDAVAIFSPDAELLFANPAMRAVLPEQPFARPLDDLFASGHALRAIVEQTLATRQSCGPVAASLEADGEAAATPAARPLATPDDPQRASAIEPGERLVMTHVIKDVDERLVGVMLVARNLDYLSRVQSTINYSRKLVALGRLSAGVAHEVKNPLNAIVIHLELLKQKLSTLRSASAASPAGSADTSVIHALGVPGLVEAGLTGASVDHTAEMDSALEHVKIITNEIRRLDEVLQGFLKFNRPEDLKLQAIRVAELLGDVVRVVKPEAEQAGVRVMVDCPSSVPDLSGDPAMLRQALLNLAINACQAMPNGGDLRISACAARGRKVELRVEDTGVGISPENLQRIFNLYFTTKAKGSGIGLSMVYRTVQLHDGDIDVASTPGRGTTFRLLLPQL